MSENMRIISINEYSSNMGKLIDVRNPLEYNKKHDIRSINIYADKLLYNHSKYLSKNKKYFIICEKGHLSKKVVRALSYYGYNVTQVVY